jgi:hypothetical protein
MKRILVVAVVAPKPAILQPKSLAMSSTRIDAATPLVFGKESVIEHYRKLLVEAVCLGGRCFQVYGAVARSFRRCHAADLRVARDTSKLLVATQLLSEQSENP